MAEADEVAPCLNGRLEFLRDVGGAATDLMDVVDVKRQATDLYGASREGDKAEDGSQEGRLAATTLTRDTDQLATTDMEVKVVEQLAVAQGESGRAEVKHQFAAVNSSRKRASFSEKRRRSLTSYLRLAMRSMPIPKA